MPKGEYRTLAPRLEGHPGARLGAVRAELWRFREGLYVRGPFDAQWRVHRATARTYARRV